MATPANDNDEARESDASVLERAAEIMRRRYGLLTAGDVVKALRNRAEAIREGEG